MIGFKDVQSYRDLQDVNILFLQGVLKKTPYHYGPIDDETIPLLEKLVTINDLGFISVMGQPALDEIKFVDRTWERNGQIYGNWWYHVQQKSMIEGYLPKAYVEEFIDFMSNQPDYYYRIYDIQIEKGWFGSKSIVLPVLHNAMPQQWVNITRDQVSKDASNLHEADWEDHTNIPSDMSPPFDFRGYPNIENIMIPYTVKVVITSKEYNSGSVEDVLLDFFYYLHKVIGG